MVQVADGAQTEWSPWWREPFNAAALPVVGAPDQWPLGAQGLAEPRLDPLPHHTERLGARRLQSLARQPMNRRSIWRDRPTGQHEGFKARRLRLGRVGHVHRDLHDFGARTKPRRL